MWNILLNICGKKITIVHDGQARLQYVSEKVDKELNEIEDSKLNDLGKSREHYEQLLKISQRCC